MAIEYIATRKVSKIGGKEKTTYCATAVTGSTKTADSMELARLLTKDTSLAPSDALSILNQLPDIIAELLRDGRRVNIEGLGSFFPAVTSTGTDTPEELTADKVELTRLSFKADARLTRELKKVKFVRKTDKQ